MSLRAWRLAFRMQRLELLILVAAAVLITVAALSIAWGASEARASFDACYQRQGTDTGCATSPSLNDFSMLGSFAILAAFLTPFALGLFLGVPVVAREIEGRTAGIAWTLSRSRTRWLVQRVLPLAVVAIVLSTAVGIGSELVTRANPYAELAANPGFYDYTARGVLLPVRALVVLLLAVGVGAMVPRQLPALLLAIAVTAALFIGLTVAMDTWMTAEAQPIPIVDELTFGNGPRIFDVAYQEDSTGKVITMNDFYNLYGDVALPDGEQNPPGFTQVAIGIPGDRYWIWAGREAAAYGALAVASGGLAAFLVRRRRP